jgi:hypothetical protein
MNYLERNKAISEEIKRGGIELQPRLKVGESRTGTQFMSLGSYDSDILGNRLHLGLKIPSGTYSRAYNSNSGLVRYRATLELAIISRIADGLPHRADQLPRFYGIALSGYNKARAILTEDLSQGGALSVESMKDRILDSFPDQAFLKELEALYGTSFGTYIGDIGMKEAAFRIGGSDGRIVLADLNQLLSHRIWPSKDVLAEMDKVLTNQAVQIRSSRR